MDTVPESSGRAKLWPTEMPWKQGSAGASIFTELHQESILGVVEGFDYGIMPGQLSYSVDQKTAILSQLRILEDKQRDHRSH